MLRIAAAIALLMQASTAIAVDPLGFYVGGALGRATININQVGNGYPLDFDENHLGWKAMGGVRPISEVGAEVEYIDLGHPSTVMANGVNADARVRGLAAFVVGFLPLPLPRVDVFGKVGIGRLHTNATASSGTQVGAPCDPSHPSPSTCGPQKLDRTDSRFAWGGGAQIRMSNISVRADYERFSSSGGSPKLLSLGISYTF